MILIIFLCTCLPFLCCLWKNVYSSLLLILSEFIFLLLSIRSYLYILHTSFLSDTWFATFSPNIFSYSIGSLCWLRSLLCRSFLVWYSSIYLLLLLPVVLMLYPRNHYQEVFFVWYLYWFYLILVQFFFWLLFAYILYIYPHLFTFNLFLPL